MEINIEPGRYRHYKGGEYEVIGLAYHSETFEPMVVYQALYDTEDLGPRPMFARPFNLFVDSVEIDGKTIPRFAKIEEPGKQAS